MFEIDIRAEGSALVAFINKEWKVSLFLRANCDNVMAENLLDSFGLRALVTMQSKVPFKKNTSLELFDGVEEIVEVLQTLAHSALSPSTVHRGLSETEVENHVKHLLRTCMPDDLRKSFTASNNTEYLVALDRLAGGTNTYD